MSMFLCLHEQLSVVFLETRLDHPLKSVTFVVTDFSGVQDRDHALAYNTILRQNGEGSELR